MLESKVETLESVTKQVKEKLNLANIFTISDLINTFPKKSVENNLSDNIIFDEKITIEAEVISGIKGSYLRGGLYRTNFNVVFKNTTINCTIFNRKFLQNFLKIGVKVFITGKITRNMQMTLSDLKTEHSDFETTYRIKDIKEYLVKKIMKEAVDKYSSYVIDVLPVEYINKYKLITKNESYQFGHFPSNPDEYKQFLRRIKYEELLIFELKLEYKKLVTKKLTNSIVIPYTTSSIEKLINELPFDLTTDQKKALDEILYDLDKTYPLNRLLEGDVGSGKTIVSFLAAMQVIETGYQVALMAPTEVLARQHYENFKTLYKDVETNIILGSTKTSDRKDILSKLEKGEIKMIFGTHALFSDDVVYSNLALVVTDEQHRFGVNQRKKLENKGKNMNVLHMSATPIPRSLAITLFGDMDLSIIRQLPKNRIPIKTKFIQKDKMDNVYKFITSRLLENEQVYVVTPLIEESEVLDLENAYKVFEDLSTRFENQVGLLHGKQSNTEKEKSYQDFIDKKTNILVSTTVVEVGVDNKNATLMVIMDADRFGLSQLHQLRGRVGRNDKQSYCLLVSDSKLEKTIERLKIIENTNDGFEIATKDLEIRGPGELFGSKQSGDLKFRFSSVVDDINILEVAKIDAQEIIKSIDNYRYKDLKKELQINNN